MVVGCEPFERARGVVAYVLARMSSIFALVRWGEMYSVVSEEAVACPKI